MLTFLTEFLIPNTKPPEMPEVLNIPSLKDIEQAHENIRAYIHHTPVLTNRQMDERCGSFVFFKCENFQKVGAFKFRGAAHTVFSLPGKEARKGVATHSSGNHAQAIAMSAKLRKIPAYIVMPENAPKVKIEAVKNYGAEITFCEPTLQARETTLDRVVQQTGATFIHPYNDPRIIAGQGTAALEFLRDYPGLDLILVPVGGGGLVSGTAIAASALNPTIKVIGTEPEIADDACQSFKSGMLIPAVNGITIADGLRTSLGELTFACIRKFVDDMVTVSEQEIIESMRFVWERMKIIIEPSSAVPVAALLNGKVDAAGKSVGVILSGGNVDLDQLPWKGGLQNIE